VWRLAGNHTNKKIRKQEGKKKKKREAKSSGGLGFTIETKI
jgi:hypothetical protein